ncbi:phytanoyl-CoA dioxygenase family protein [Paenibacillus montanisoli]|nr:phytanoyl-CoA dioxygenase family protein [Paenibacillus montanisoli]
MNMEKQVNELPDLDSTYEITVDQIAEYRKNGHVMIRQAAKSDEIKVYEPIFTHWVKELNYHDKPVEERDTYGKAFIQIGNLWLKSEQIKRFVTAKRFAKIAAQLMGVKAVRLYHDQALFKEPGGGHTPWHQDQIYWPFNTDKMITMWMPLVPISEQIGSMTFASGSQKMGYISKLVISDESHRSMAEYIEGKGFEKVTYGAMAAGDATFHAGWTLHSAPGNPTDTLRKVMTVIYVADDAVIVEPDSNARRSDLAGCLPGQKPGETPCSPLNPLLYSEDWEA